jgi:hypothetical protein
MWAIFGGEGEGLGFWTGGENWSLLPDDAARFVDKVDAEATIDVLRRAISNLSSKAHAVQLS